MRAIRNSERSERTTPAKERMEHVSDNRQATIDERCRCFGILFPALLKEGVM